MLKLDLFREIKKTKNRFISIVLLVVIAVAFLYGLKISAPDMHASMDAYLDEQHMHDVQIMSTLGLTDEDIAALSAIDGVENIEGIFSVDAIASNGEDATMVVKAISISEQGINDPYLEEGRMPEAADECLIEAKYMEQTGAKIGDTLLLDSGTGVYEDALDINAFTIVGVAKHPLYTTISRGNSTLGNGSVGCILMLPADAYALDYYTEINLTVAGAASLDAYSSEYEEVVAAVTDEVEAIQADREAARTAEIKGEAQDELDEGWNEYYDGEAEANAELDSARAELDSAASDLAQGWEDYYSGLDDIAAGEALIAENEQKLADGYAALAENEALYESGLAQYDDGYAQWEQGVAELAATREQMLVQGMPETMVDSMLAPYRAELDAAKAELDANKVLLDSTRAQLDAGKAELDAASATLNTEKQKLAEGRAELEQGYTDLVSGEEAYKKGVAQYHSGKDKAERELAEALNDLKKAQGDIDAIEPAEWYVMDRSSNTGFAAYESDAERMDRLADVIPIVFFLVAALVCLTGMTRMVEEERIRIGGLKALGYSKWATAEKYVGYGLLASLIGSGFGLLLGATLLPYIIASCWKVMYSYPGVVLTFEWGPAILCVALAVGCCALAALAAVLNSLRASAATLMRPKAPKAGKRVLLERIPFLWKRLSFTRKVACRNLFRYKKRFWMTVIGIAGCTGLLVTGFGLYHSITDVIDLQFSEVSKYSAVVYVGSDLDDAEREELYTALDNETILEDYQPCCLDTVTLESDIYTLDGNLFAVDDPADAEGFWTLRERKTDIPQTIGDDGVVISEKTAELLGLSVGDPFTVVYDDHRGEMTVSGIMENYVSHYVFATKDYCEETLGIRPADEQILLRYDVEDDWESMGSRLLALDEVVGIYYQSEAQSIVENQLQGVYPAVVIIILASGALAFVVLFNLSDINITERRRELATLRVLGFRDKEMRQYVFRENVILTLFGIALGLVFGYYFHAFVMSTVEVDLVMFGREPHYIGYVLSALITMFFAAVVNAIAGKNLNKIDMVESMKSVE